MDNKLGFKPIPAAIAVGLTFYFCHVYYSHRAQSFGGGYYCESHQLRYSFKLGNMGGCDVITGCGCDFADAFGFVFCLPT